MAQTTDVPPAEAPLEPPPDGEAAAVEGAEVEEAAPEVIRVRSSGLRGPLLYAAIAIPTLLVSFLGAWFFAGASAAPVAVVHEEWSYEGEHGPTHWGEVDPHNS